MYWFRALLFFITVAMVSPVPAHAQSRGVEPTLAFETLSPKAGSIVRVALVMDAKPGWHAYWKNPGDVGAPPRIEWSVPGDFIFSDLRHPAPKLLNVQGIASFVHEGSFALLTTMRVPNGLAAGEPIPISARVSWLACSETQCVPESKTIERMLVVGEGETDYPGLSRIRQAEARIPAETVKGRFTYDGDRFVLKIPGRDLSSARLFPDGQGWLDASSSVKGSDGFLSIAADRARKQSRFSGVLRTGSDSVLVTADWSDPPVKAVEQVSASSGAAALPGGSPLGDVPFTENDAALAQSRPDVPGVSMASEETSTGTPPGESRVGLLPVLSSGPGSESFVSVLLAAFVGGLLLNLMPCVFPILSLKAISLARSSSGERTARAEGAGYALGTVVTVLGLGAFILVMREFGSSAGWSFQLQSPAFVLAMLGLVTVITLNLAGSFEFAQLGRSAGIAAPGFRGAMGTGAMAALIASPCAGPFMAGALGAALVLPTIAALAVFAGLGLGMAAPFLLIAFVPALRSRLPRPGPWMGRLRRILAVPMALTAVWLLWILWRQAGDVGLFAGTALLAAMIVGTQVIGRTQRGGASARTPALLTTGLAVLVFASFSAVDVESASAEGTVAAEGVVFSEEALMETVSTGTPVLLDFTADWCLTCKVNEKVALDDEKVLRALDESGVVVMTGDWTNGDPAITAFLEKNGRNSIPFYVLYDGKGGAKVLPQVLTPSLLVSEIESVR